MNPEFQTSNEFSSESNRALINLVEVLGSDDAFADRLSNLTQELDAIEGQTYFYMREQQIDHLSAQGRVAEHQNEINAIYDQVGLYEAELSNNPEYIRYVSLKRRIDELVNNNRDTLLSTDPAAESLVTILSRVSGINNEQQAPFMNYKQNTAEAWQYVPEQAVQDYLDELYFVNTDYAHLDGNTVTVRAERGASHPVPLSLFVHAAGFTSWKGRPEGNNKSWSSREYGNGGSKSIDTIKHYAALPTDIPPVSEVNVYIQPEGTIFADNLGDSHRIGAAFLRGQKEIPAEKINFVRLHDNFLQSRP